MDSTPSTSGVKMSKKNDGKASQPVLSEEDMLTLRSLDIISKIAGMLKTETNGFVTILEKVLALVDGDQKDERKMTYDLVQNVMSSILEADMEELRLAKQHFDKIYSQRKFKDMLIDEKNLLRMGLLGEGGFSHVLLGQLKLADGTQKTVAIKRAKLLEHNALIDNEALALSKLKHKNILKMYGKHKSEPEIILELMDLGNLVSAVEKVTFTTENLLKLLHDVASGMEYMADKKYLHRDVACQNVFLNKKKRCKIGDLGFAVYVGDSNGKYVEKVFQPSGYNLSPETRFTKVFTVANDVWAMGILIWELFYIMEHAGEIPSASLTKRHLIGLYLIKKWQLSKSKLCPEKLHAYNLNSVLNEDPKARPNFSTIRAKIEEIMTAEKKD